MKKTPLFLLMLAFVSVFLLVNVSHVSASYNNTYNATDDGYTVSQSGTQVSQSADPTHLQIYNDDTYHYQSWFNFAIDSNLSGMAVNSAYLYVDYYDGDGTPAGRSVLVQGIGESWSESTLCYNNKPSLFSFANDTATFPSGFQWIAFDVTDLIKGVANGSVAFNGIEFTFSDEDSSHVSMYSSEYSGGTSAPFLEINYDSSVANTTIIANATVSINAYSTGCSHSIGVLGNNASNQGYNPFNTADNFVGFFASYADATGATAESISAYIGGVNGDVNFTFAIYSGNGTLLGQTNPTVETVATSPQWFTLNLQSPVSLVHGENYFIVAWSGSTAYLQTTTYGSGTYTAGYSYTGTCPSSLSFSWGSSEMYNIYLTYDFPCSTIVPISNIAISIIAGALNYIANATVTIISGAINYISSAIITIVSGASNIISSIWASIIVEIQTNNPPSGLAIPINFIIFLLMLIIPTMILWSYVGSIAVAPTVILMTIISFMAGLIPLAFVILVVIVAIGILFRRQIPVINRGNE